MFPKSKQCTKCKETKETSEFSKRGDTKNLRSHCITCNQKSNLERYHYNTSTQDSHRKAGRRYQMKQYGITEQVFHEMLDKQEGKCVLCATPIEYISNDISKVAVVDHCHTTGFVRGLLCRCCNSGLGFFKDNITSLKNAVDYLKGYDDGEVSMGSGVERASGRSNKDTLLSN